MFNALKLAFAALISAAGLFSQSPPARPAFNEFEVATIKPSDLDSVGRWIRMERCVKCAPGRMRNSPLMVG